MGVWIGVRACMRVRTHTHSHTYANVNTHTHTHTHSKINIYIDQRTINSNGTFTDTNPRIKQN